VAGLLISIRNSLEASIAKKFPIDLFDLKDPARGTLGAVNPEERKRILGELADRPKSIALGELTDWNPEQILIEDWSWLEDFQFAKVGMAQACAPGVEWRERWKLMRSQIPITTCLVAVAYADWRLCKAPSIEQIFDFINHSLAEVRKNETRVENRRPGRSPRDSRYSHAILIDTFDKSTGSSVEILGLSYLATVVKHAQLNQIKLVIAGSLDIEHLEPLAQIAPDFIGARGAVCDFNRTSLSEAKLAAFVQRGAEVFSRYQIGAPPEP
jgi:(5-formylfuran-3-yl)methyl phosphate synthase